MMAVTISRVRADAVALFFIGSRMVWVKVEKVVGKNQARLLCRA
jgi:hypothetical protein